MSKCNEVNKVQPLKESLNIVLKNVVIHVSSDNNIFSIQDPFREGLLQVFHESEARRSVIIPFV